ncbi:hypothetical protein [Rubrivivax sp. A210]|uniref:hypothetical protein n=1 Tax=Rubrivivax sp. A210 TaxID=2772301 RepID=UPI0019195628|nr:hypothetical protein [Rubrivivax sp. A210]
MQALPKRIRSETELSSLPVKVGSILEQAVFEAMLDPSSLHGIQKVYKCNGLWADGYFVKSDGTRVPFEIKTTLGWQQLATGVFQILSLNQVKPLHAIEGWLIYERVSAAWEEKNTANPLQEAWYCLSEIHAHLPIKLCQFVPGKGLVVHSAPTAA